jgi:DNA-binding response OmpR family regulator
MLDFEQLYRQTKDLTILFVEDYEPLREKVTEILEDFFKVVVEAVDGEEGLEHYKAYEENHGRPFDIVLTDIKMPKKDGLELTQEIQKIHEDQVIVILSAHQESEYLLKFINMGIAQFIPKPIEPDTLLEVMEQVTKKIKKKPESNLGNLNEIILHDDLIWNKTHNALLQNSKPVELTKNELLVMGLLTSKVDYVCSIDEIMSYFYDNGLEINSESIRNMMSRLRKKMPPNVISNIYGLGYKLSKQH